ncbi:uncharacterized protein LOC115695948 isoform X2 [Cannabis sativa]|uniref:uncharacterized protein LOC115695948 isoform X2 n=1 Tax=Cannabis sativa TaxID=3483 RepID=UPI0029C9DF2F|nr:uncharacterized protein LOC115695948 isoform X2 [Cannabis sativa]
MSFYSSLSPLHLHPQSPQILSSISSKSKPKQFNTPAIAIATSTFSSSSSIRYGVKASGDVPNFLSEDWLESRKKRPFGPRLNFGAEEAVQHQLDALKFNDQPRQDYGIEVMYRRIFHHSTYRVLLGHRERKILSSLFVEENRFKQRVWIRGNRPEEEEVFQFTMIQRVGGSWDGYWLTESLLHDGDPFAGGLAY